MTVPPQIPIEVAAHIVAAGIHGDVARVTVAFTPIIANADTKLYLQAWPEVVDGLLEEKDAQGMPKQLAELFIQPLGPGESWRSPTFVPIPGILKLKRIGSTNDTPAIGGYWRKVMGGDKGFNDLKVALDPKAADPLNTTMRPSNDPNILEKVPDLHGTSRSKSVGEHSFERVRHIIGRLNNKMAPTRGKPRADQSMTALVEQWSNSNPRPLQSSNAPPLTPARVAALNEDEIAWSSLGASRKRANIFAQARRTFLTSSSPGAAIQALTDALKSLATRTPATAALAAGALDVLGKPLGIEVSEASAAYRLASRTPTNEENLPTPPPEDIELARRRLFTIQTNPSLGRLFRFVVDFSCATADLEKWAKTAQAYDDGAALDLDVSDKELVDPVALGDGMVQSAYFLLVGLSETFKGRRILSIAKCRLRGGNGHAGHFYPCTREEIDARAAGKTSSEFRASAVAEQIDGIVDLGQSILDANGLKEPRYDIMTLDPITATGSEYNRVLTDLEKALALDKHQLPQKIRKELNDPNDPKNPTQRGGGLALGDRWRQWHGILRHIDSAQQRDDYEVPAARIVLDASDLTMGYKLDVGIRLKNDSVKRSRWHTLMHRYVSYSAAAKAKLVFAPSGLNHYISSLYPDSAARREADDGQLQLPTALRDWTAEAKPIQVPEQVHNWTTAFTEEIVGAWRGDPLGLACGRETHILDLNKALPIDMSYSLPSLNDPGYPVALTPPPLRFGWRYRFGLRAMFTGGVSMPLNRAFGHYERDYDGDLVKPNAKHEHGQAYLRHERIDAPTITVPDWLFGSLKPNKIFTKVMLQGRFPVAQAGRMMIRSFDDPGNRKIALPEAAVQEKLPGIDFDRRVVLAPAVSLDFATLHDAFRGKKASDFEYAVKMCEPRLLGADDKPNSTVEDAHTEFVPIPVGGGGEQKWDTITAYWHPYSIVSRPKGGLSAVDHRAAWGGFPVYRASLSAGGVEPKRGDEVRAPPAPITDEGEILHRTKSAGFKIFEKDATKTQTVLWSAVGILEGERGLSERSGTAVFRPLPSGRNTEVERLPYYPDPAATSMVILVVVRDDPANPLWKEVRLYDDIELKGPAAKDYPNARSVVIDIVRGNKKAITVTPKTSYASLPRTPGGTGGGSISVSHVTIMLAPGEEADISCWCVPSETYLAYMCAASENLAAMAVATGQSISKDKGRTIGTEQAFFEGLENLVPVAKKSRISKAADPKDQKAKQEELGFSALGGLAIPGPAQSFQLAKFIRDTLLRTPIPEIAAVTHIEAVHAVDLPLREATADQAGKKWALLRATTAQIPFILKENPAVRNPDPHRELYDSNNWTLKNQMAGAIDVLIDGSVSIHGPSTGTIEIRASGAAAARGRFDDVDRGRSRDDRARGLWPKPDAVTYMDPKKLFGFDVSADGSVVFGQETVTLLRLEGFPSGTGRIDLLDVQRKAETFRTRDPKDPDAEDSPLRAQRPAAFPDARARYIKLFAVAISRHAGSLRTRYDELPETLSRPADNEQIDMSKPLAQFWLASTMRPSRAVPQSPIPSFVWQDSTPIPPKDNPHADIKLPSVFVKRSMRVRVRLKRPWFTSGEGERVGIVIWPPNLFALDGADLRNDRVKPPPIGRNEINLKSLPPDGTNLPFLQDADLGAGGGWVTRWAADPIRELGKVEGWLLSKDNFPHVEVVNDPAVVFSRASEKHPSGAFLVENVLMPVPVDADAQPTVDAEPAGGFMAVSLVTFAPRFDPEQENWYVDIDVSPCGSVYPFIRLGLVRFQPNAPRALQVSEPVVEWTQIMPERKVSATAKGRTENHVEKVLIDATVEGMFSQPDPSRPNSRESTERAPQMHVTLLRRWAAQDGESLGPETVYGVPQILVPTCATGCMTWNTSFSVPRADYDKKSEEWSLFVEEVDRLRPASYGDEPRYETRNDENFVDAGPRFTARLPLRHLKIMEGKDH